MAYEGQCITLPGLTAAADLSTKQFYFVKKNTTDNQVALCSVDGEVVLGVLQNKPAAAGRAATVVVHGVTKVVASETLTAGDKIGTDNAGKAKIVEISATGADVGDYVYGTVIEGCAANELATVFIGAPAYRVFAS